MRGGGVLSLLVALAALGAGCELPPQPAIDDPDAVFVSVEVLEADAPVSVDATRIRRVDGLLRHGVTVMWEGEDEVVLDDARFVHHVRGDRGQLLLAGRGCGWSWTEEDGFMGVCTDDLQVIEVGRGDVHEYPVAIHPEVGPDRLGFGIFVVEERIAWYRADDGMAGPSGDSEGTFTIRLTYEVPG